MVEGNTHTRAHAHAHIYRGYKGSQLFHLCIAVLNKSKSQMLLNRLMTNVPIIQQPVS